MTDRAETTPAVNSELPGFYSQSRCERLRRLQQEGGIPKDVIESLAKSLSPDQANLMVENVVGEFSLPLSIATNFRVDGQDYLVPMAIEEPSVVAAASKAAKMARTTGGFFTTAGRNLMICQLLLMNVPDPQKAQKSILDESVNLLSQVPVSPSVAAAGGGPRDLTVRFLPDTEAGTMLVLHLTYDVGDAMGANIVNTAGEYLAPKIAALTGGEVVTSILSNLADERLASAQVLIPWYALSTDREIAETQIHNICRADTWARVDPYRATTHNKGILNGIGSIAMATGNDWRAVEAGAHAWAARGGFYQGLTRWNPLVPGRDIPEPWLNLGNDYDLLPALHGEICLPLVLGTVGGASGSHPTARGALALLGYPTARRLTRITAAVGLAQNLAALRALTLEGIQSGHMRLHARQLAMNVGIPLEKVAHVATLMVDASTITQDAARQFWRELQSKEEGDETGTG